MQLIEKIVVTFYQKATTDTLIGYHFRKIQKSSSKNPLYPQIEQFSEHIPRIIKFWRQQLNLLEKKERPLPFDILNVHRKLKVRKGEINRWVLLFEETLNEQKIEALTIEEIQVIKSMRQKALHFQKIFLEHLF